jgi:hypothetical protein
MVNQTQFFIELSLPATWRACGRHAVVAAKGAVVQSQPRSIDSIDTSSDAAAEATSFK